MKLAKINPAKLFKPKKTRSVTRSEPDQLSFGSQTTSSSSAVDSGAETPITVLRRASSAVEFELKQAFQMIDADNDGKVKKEELEALLSRLGAAPPSSDELKLMLNEVDADGDGSISLEEFYAIGSAFEPPSCDEEMRLTFDFFDSDRDGKITAEELYEVFAAIGGCESRCTLEECRKMIEGVDRNGDGFVCYADFSRMMEHQLR